MELSESCYPHVCAFFSKRHGLKSEMGQLRQSQGEFQCRASCCPIPVELRAAPIPPSKTWDSTHRVLPNRTFTCTVGACPLGSLTMWLMIRALGPRSITVSLDRLKVKGWSTLPTWSGSRRNLKPANQVRFLVISPVEVLSHITTSRSEHCSHSPRRGQLEAPCLEPFSTLPLHPFPWQILICVLLQEWTIIMSRAASKWVLNPPTELSKHIAQQSPNFTNTEKESFPETLICTQSLCRIGPALPALCMDGAHTSVGRWIWSHYLHPIQEDRNSSAYLIILGAKKRTNKF